MRKRLAASLMLLSGMYGLLAGWELNARDAPRLFMVAVLACGLVGLLLAMTPSE